MVDKNLMLYAFPNRKLSPIHWSPGLGAKHTSIADYPIIGAWSEKGTQRLAAGSTMQSLAGRLLYMTTED